MTNDCDILVIGGGTGGCAAAMAAAGMGLRVIVTEETDWIGGQLTSQAVPPDEHPWIEQAGCTARYRRYRNLVRRYYHDHYPLTAEARAITNLNPGDGGVSLICHEPRVGLAVLDQMLAPEIAAGRVEILLNTVPVSAETAGDRVRAITVRHLHTGAERTLRAPFILDATELGDLLPMTGTEFVTGAESRAETGEPHAVDGPAQPDNVQGITWCFAMSHDPAGPRESEKPAQYERWRDYVPTLTPPWVGPLLRWERTSPLLKPAVDRLFSDDGSFCMWLYRRIVSSARFAPGAVPYDVTIVNWPQNDYWEGNLIGASPADAARYLEEARQMSLSFFHWMRTEAPRPDGGTGYPGLFLRGDITGTPDGLAKAVYIREARRIRALFTVTENHVGTEARDGAPAEMFGDSVGVGSYRIDLHPTTGGDNYLDISSQPFQIPLGALIPQRVENLIPACKNIGTTHITNGCYRLHPVEWNIGEAAGLLAAYALRKSVPPRAVREDGAMLKDFQSLLVRQGIELAWPALRAM